MVDKFSSLVSNGVDRNKTVKTGKLSRRKEKFVISSTLLALRCTFLPTKVLHATHKSYSFLFKFLETSPCRSRLLIIEFSSFAARQDNTDDI